MHGCGEDDVAPMTADQGHALANLTDAQALTALNVFASRALQYQGTTLEALEQALVDDPATDQAIHVALTANPIQTAALARNAMSVLMASEIEPLSDLADRALLDAEMAATLHGPLSLLIGGGIAVGLLFVLLLDRVGPDGVLMRQKMPTGLPQVLEKAGGLVEKVTELIAAFKSAPPGKD